MEATNKQAPLFGDFSPKTKAEWVEKVTKDLKGASFEEKLIWKTDEGFDLNPFYNKEDIEGLSHLSAIHQSGLDPERLKQGFSARDWSHCEGIAITGGKEKEANAKALNALNQGSSAIAFEVAGSNPIAWSALFQEIQWGYCSIAFHIAAHQWDIVTSLVAYLEEAISDKSQLNGYLLFEEGTSLDAGQLSYLHTSTVDYPHFRGLSAQVGEGKVSEKVGGLLYGYYQLVQQLGNKATSKAILDNTCFHYPLDNLYFFQIAGLRSLRFLLKQMATAYGVQGETTCTVRAITGITIDDATKKDPEWNMLTNTTQAMSGILGGCDYLTVQPHIKGIEEVDAFADRIARNVSNLLRDESHFDKVVDPVAGAYYMEQLTEKLGEKAWENFQSRI